MAGNLSDLSAARGTLTPVACCHWMPKTTKLILSQPQGLGALVAGLCCLSPGRTLPVPSGFWGLPAG